MSYHDNIFKEDGKYMGQNDVASIVEPFDAEESKTITE
jgi:hypothetical protein